MLTSLKASLIGKSEYRHAEGGFVLTFHTQTAAGPQELKTWVSDAEGAKFPYGKDEDGNEIPQRDYTIIVTDLDAADDDGGLALQAHVAKLEEEIATSGEALAKAEEANAALEDELAAKKTELENLAEELETTKADLLAAKEAEANLRGQVETLEQELESATEGQSA